MPTGPYPKSKTPNKLVNSLLDFCDVQRDINLCRILKIHHSSIVRYRKGEIGLSATLVLKVYDLTGWTIEKIRELAGVDK